jgi:hypothetical protein
VEPAIFEQIHEFGPAPIAQLFSIGSRSPQTGPADRGSLENKQKSGSAHFWAMKKVGIWRRFPTGRRGPNPHRCHYFLTRELWPTLETSDPTSHDLKGVPLEVKSTRGCERPPANTAFRGGPCTPLRSGCRTAASLGLGLRISETGSIAGTVRSRLCSNLCCVRVFGRRRALDPFSHVRACKKGMACIPSVAQGWRANPMHTAV